MILTEITLLIFDMYLKKQFQFLISKYCFCFFFIVLISLLFNVSFKIV